MPQPDLTVSVYWGPTPDFSDNTSPHLSRFRHVPYPVEHGCCFPQRLLLPPLESFHEATSLDNTDGNAWTALFHRLLSQRICHDNEDQLVESVKKAFEGVEVKGSSRPRIEKAVKAKQSNESYGFQPSLVRLYETRPDWLKHEAFVWSSAVVLRSLVGAEDWDATEDVRALRAEADEKSRIKRMKEAMKEALEAKAKQQAQVNVDGRLRDDLGQVNQDMVEGPSYGELDVPLTEADPRDRQSLDDGTHNPFLNQPDQGIVLGHSQLDAGKAAEFEAASQAVTSTVPRASSPVHTTLPANLPLPRAPPPESPQLFLPPTPTIDHLPTHLDQTLSPTSDTSAPGHKGKKRVATDGGDSAGKRGKRSDGSQKEGAHKPDIILRSGVLFTLIWFIMEFKFVNLDRRHPSYSTGLIYAMKEAIYQASWYLHMGYKFNGVRHGMAWVDDRFVRLIICGDGSLGIERLDLEVPAREGVDLDAMSRGGNVDNEVRREGGSVSDVAQGTDVGERPSATKLVPSDGCIAIEELERSTGFWDFNTLGHRLVHKDPERSNDTPTTTVEDSSDQSDSTASLVVNLDAYNILLACILSGLWYAAAHTEPKPPNDSGSHDKGKKSGVSTTESGPPTSNDRLLTTPTASQSVIPDSTTPTMPFCAPNDRKAHELYDSYLYNPSGTHRIDRGRDMTTIHGLRETNHVKMHGLKSGIKAKEQGAKHDPKNGREGGGRDNDGGGDGAGADHGASGNGGGNLDDQNPGQSGGGGHGQSKDDEHTHGKGGSGSGSGTTLRTAQVGYPVTSQPFGLDSKPFLMDQDDFNYKAEYGDDETPTYSQTRIFDHAAVMQHYQDLEADLDYGDPDKEAGTLDWAAYRARLILAGVKIRFFTSEQMDREWHSPGMFARGFAEPSNSASSGFSVPATVIITPPKPKTRAGHSNTHDLGDGLQSKSTRYDQGGLDVETGKRVGEDTLARGGHNEEQMDMW